MMPIHLIQVLMKNEAFQKLHSLSNANRGEQRIQNPTANLSGILPSLDEAASEHAAHKSSPLQMDTIELTSNESNQLLQITFQHPAYTNFTFRLDGRKKNGKIDPEFCHLLFSIELNYLKQVVLDVKVQNRILTIAIFNDTEEIGALVEELKHTIQTNLEKQGYLLSSIKIVNTGSDEQPMKTGLEGFHERVDFKI
ncbi:hypothetical protein [Bacillus sp. REN16]|uniref:hypothetical protein n=1 Tax=Bacillus sp. REN16 TaxID=2887296 RepID=UPI001E60535A|nr:hypothetical protein [Bacillus sp. REN16]MCC3357489.1 hypothetical protein [Bacillus sp. REN16]